MLEWKQIVPADLSPKEWEYFYGWTNDLRAVYYPDDTPPEFEVFKKLRLRSHQANPVREWLLFEKGHLQGKLMYTVHNHNTPGEYAFVFPAGMSPAFADNYIDEIGIKLMEIMSEFGHDQIYFSTNDIAIQSMIQKWSGEPTNTLCFYRLERNQLNKKLQKKWLKSVDLVHEGLRHEWLEDLSEPMIEPFADLFTDCLNSIIRSDTRTRYEMKGKDIRELLKRAEAANMSFRFLLLFNMEGSMVGMTNLTVPNSGKGEANQWMTGFRKEFRGRSIGKWMKAKSLEYLFKSFPRIKSVRTDSYHTNLPMIKINEAIGFQSMREIPEFRVYKKGIETTLSDLPIS